MKYYTLNCYGTDVDYRSVSVENRIVTCVHEEKHEKQGHC
jgi:hypothetical protein